MRSEKEMLSMAATMKVAMVNRMKRIENLSSLVVKADMGFSPASPERIETAREDLAEAMEFQRRDAQRYAVMRWVCGVADSIDPHNLELDK